MLSTIWCRSEPSTYCTRSGPEDAKGRPTNFARREYLSRSTCAVRCQYLHKASICVPRSGDVIFCTSSTSGDLIVTNKCAALRQLITRKWASALDVPSWPGIISNLAAAAADEPVRERIESKRGRSVSRDRARCIVGMVCMGARVSDFVGAGYGDNVCEWPCDFEGVFFIADRRGRACWEDVR